MKQAKPDAASDAALAKIAAMPEPFRALGERLNDLILRSGPSLVLSTWYGMPAYAKDGKILCFFRADKRCMTLGLTPDANVARESKTDGLMECAWYFVSLDSVTEDRIAEIVRNAVR